MKNLDLNKLSLNIALSLLILIFCLFFLSSLGFIFGLAINLFYLLISIVIAIYLPQKIIKSTPEISLISFLFCIFLILVSGYISIKLFDVTNDGQWYHQTGVIFLRKGWNPIYETAQSFFQKRWIANITDTLIWVESYPKFYEIIAANVYYLTNNIEIGKLLNIISLIMLFFYSFYVASEFCKKQNSIYTYLLSLVLICNPIMFVQMHSYYTDGLVYVYFMMMLLSVLNMELTKKTETSTKIIFIISAICLGSIKLGTILYVLCIFACYVLYLLVLKQKKKLKTMGMYGMIIFLLLLLANINPYITNIHKGKHIFYPIAGEEKVDIMEYNMPSQFFDKPMYYKLFMSTFSEVNGSMSQFISLDHPIKLKIPFSIKKNEIEMAGIYDTRQSGFGVFWSGILILAVFLSFQIKFKSKKDKHLFIFMISTLLTSVLLNPENWWARYVPQFYALPVIISLFLCFKENNKSVKITNILLLLFMISNSLMSYGSSLQMNIKKTEYKNIQLINMEKQKRNAEIIKELETSETRQDFTAPVLLFLEKYGSKK